jgi:hypothetical protein
MSPSPKIIGPPKLPLPWLAPPNEWLKEPLDLLLEEWLPPE